jgi:glucose dehydrogenase
MRKIIVAALVCWTGIATATEGDNWPAGGRDQEGTYYSPLAKINNQNVGKLGFAWA